MSEASIWLDLNLMLIVLSVSIFDEPLLGKMEVIFKILSVSFQLLLTSFDKWFHQG
jgi:hypothetical protein